MSIKAKRLVFKEHGDPEKVLQLEEFTLNPDTLKDDEVLVRWLSSPINPADVLMINGTYGIRPPLPTVGGMEGAGAVEKVGSKVTTLKPGDWVLSGPIPVGCWASHSVVEADKLIPIGKEQISKVQAATLLINPPTAYRLLKDIVELKPGDVVVQNGANSACGLYVIQFARLWGYKTVNIIRDRPNVQQVKDELKAMGADEVYTQEEFQKVAPSLKGVRLAIDCVGGDKTLPLYEALEDGGTVVVYGALSSFIGQVPAGGMIFHNARVQGFWIMRYYAQNPKGRDEMFAEITKLLREGKLKDAPFTEHKIENFVEAFRSHRSSSNRKQIFVF